MAQMKFFFFFSVFLLDFVVPSVVCRELTCSLTHGTFSPQVSIPRGTPLVYELDNDFVPVSTPGSLGPLRGRFLCNPVDLARALQQESIAAQLGPMAGTGSVAHGEGAIERVERALGNV